MSADTDKLLALARECGMSALRQLQPRAERTQNGITHAQAMEVGRRFYEEAHAAPTISHAMALDYETVCAVLGGRLWPGVRRFWMDRVFP